MQSEAISKFRKDNNACLQKIQKTIISFWLLNNEILESKIEITDGSKERAEKDCEQNECCVPVVLIVDCIDAEEHEDNRF